MKKPFRFEGLEAGALGAGEREWVWSRTGWMGPSPIGTDTARAYVYDDGRVGIYWNTIPGLAAAWDCFVCEDLDHARMVTTMRVRWSDSKMKEGMDNE